MKTGNKVLIVDDSDINITIISEIIGDESKIATASTGEEAIKIARIFRPDLILLDIVMPDMDGYETCRHIRSDPDLCHIKIILVSAKTETSDRLMGYEAGADDFIIKPFDPDELVAKVNVFLRLKFVEELDRIKEDILHLLNHETRTPLSSISSALQLLTMDKSISESEVAELLAIGMQNCDRLQSLIEKSMLLCEIRSQTVEMHMEPIGIDALVAKAVSIQQSFADQREIKVQVEVTPDCLVYVDLEYLALALSSILNNAIKSSPSPGGEVVVEFSENRGQVTLAVIDRGPGIDPAYLPFVFDAFVPQDILHHKEGHGLSLAICREIIELHGGKVATESIPNQMTGFFVTLPIAAKDTTEVEAEGADACLVTS